MTVPASSVSQDYLKAVYGAGEWTGEGVTTSALAARMGVSASTVSETVRRLAAAGLVDHERYGLVTLDGAWSLQAADAPREAARP